MHRPVDMSMSVWLMMCFRLSLIHISGLIVFNVGAAAAGTWQGAITGEALGRVQVDGGELPGSMEIQQFQVVKRGGAFYVSWKVLDCPERLRFQVFADTDADGFDGEEIASFPEAAEGEREIQFNLMDTGEYFLYLRVSSDSGCLLYTSRCG